MTACGVCFAAAANAADGLAATLTTETAGSVQTSHQALLAQSSVTSLASNGMALRGEAPSAPEHYYSLLGHLKLRCTVLASHSNPGPCLTSLSTATKPQFPLQHVPLEGGSPCLAWWRTLGQT